MQQLIGQSIGRYHIVEKLGEGGMATVYKAFDTHLETNVAIKITHTDRFETPAQETILKRFEREAKEVAKLSHPNIIKVTDYGDFEGTPYLVMPYVEGGSLKQRLGAPIPADEAVALLSPILDALAYAHSQNIIHRDVKPANILITATGQPMLSDFGIAKILESNDGTTLTGTGVGLGTPEYMAPEQWLGAFGPSVDIYAAGVVLYELLTGKKPYVADTPAAVLLKQAKDPLPRPTSIDPSIPYQLENILYKALAKKPEDRYLTMTDFSKALKNYKSLQPAIQPPDLPFVNKKRKLPIWIVAAGTALLTILIAFAVWALIKPKLSAPTDKIPTSEPGVNLEATSVPYGAMTSSPTVKPTKQDTPVNQAYSSGDKQVAKSDGMTLLYVPAGEFIMGSPEGVGDLNESPQHTVYLDAFWIDQTEVTNGMYQKCVTAGICLQPLVSKSYTHESYYGNAEFADFPVIFVTWQQAKKYCKWVGRRLPTEAEWEKAARGTKGVTYPWGENQPNDTLVNYQGHNPDLVRVGSFPSGASPYGALDMAGNVFEWVSDWFDPEYFQVSPSRNPTGPGQTDKKTVKGGSWLMQAYSQRSAVRASVLIDEGLVNVGFRCAMDGE